ncbi:MAG TPA: CocE/NonD family hydrolase [Verrucomicrobiae bacterium]|nr:CocE/NonD family hydrolase [Verrucomicrobiae bacterium]
MFQRRILNALVFVFVFIFVAPAGVRAQQTSEPSYGVTVQGSVPMKTRDGVTLYADIYRPKADGKFPVVLMRTPYDKSTGWAVDPAFLIASHGYVVIIQDVRGRYTSEGEWYPFRHESADGYDTVEWAAALPYSDGKVGMMGASYVGATQMLAAIAHPPHLAGICPQVTASNYHDGWTYQGGAFEQWFDQNWTTQLAGDTLHRMIEKNTDALIGAPTLPLTAYPLFNYDSLPAGSSASAELAPYYLDWLAHPDYDEYWKQWSIEEFFPQIQVPVLNVGAWYDIFLRGTLRNYMGIKAHGGSEAARNGQRLLIQIGGHAGFGKRIGDVDFGDEAVKFPYTQVVIDWYDYLFKGVHNEFSTDKPVRLFLMGDNAYRQEADWPPPEAKPASYYLHSDGSANSLRGNGSLSLKEPKAEPIDKFTYDPANPVPTIGGPLCCDAEHYEPGPRDQRAAENRDDVLVYSTKPLAEDLEVIGPVSLDLWVKSSAVDTDFTGKLVDVAPDGLAMDVAEGILRMRYRDSQEKPDLMNPGQVYKITVDMVATGNVFKKGHVLRLEVSSSNFPRFDRNLNTGAVQSTSKDFVSATNTVLHDSEHPSAVVLSVVPAGD